MPDPNITEVHFCNVPIENDYRNTIWFPDQDTQLAYFTGKRVSGCSFTDFSYQRKEHYIRVPMQWDLLMSKGCNYVMYRNNAYKGVDGTAKWFYAFITDMVYKDDGRTDVFIETDVMQTWMGMYTVKPSFIEREHCKLDTPINNTQPENFELGEYVSLEGASECRELTEFGIVVGSTVDASANLEEVLDEDGVVIGHRYPTTIGNIYNGVFSGAKYFFFEKWEDAEDFITKLDKYGQGDAIVSMFMFPKALVGTMYGDKITLTPNAEPQTITWGDETYSGGTITKPKTLDGIAPNNQKLFTYPYCYLKVCNNAGAEAIYHYELFKDVRSENLTSFYACKFEIDSALTAGGSVWLSPLQYAGEPKNYTQGLAGGKYPMCSWANDAYINWLTQNSANLSIAEQRGLLNVRSGAIDMSASLVGGAIKTLGNVLSGNIGGAANAGVSGTTGYLKGEIARENGYLDISSVTAQKYQHSLTAPQSKGASSCGDVMFACKKNTFTAHHMSIKREYVLVIDKYFDMYGYATNLVKEPYSDHRRLYWFTKTIACNVDGNIPNTDMDRIRQCYNNGITFWRRTANIGDYSARNDIVETGTIK